MNIPIQPVSTFPGTAVELRVDYGMVELDVGASFQWALLDVNGNVVAGPGRLPLTDQQYLDWAEDDSVVAKAIAANVGVTPI